MLWETLSPSILRPGFHMHLHPLEGRQREPVLGVISVVNSQKIVLHLKGHDSRMSQGKGVSAMGTAQRGLIKFQTTVHSGGAGANLICLLTPDVVYRRALRKHQRLNVNVNCIYRAFQFEGGTPYPEHAGEVLDISKGGLLLSCPIRPESKCLRILLDLPSCPRISADCLVQHIRGPVQDSECFRAGLKFELIETQLLRSLNIFIAMRTSNEA